MGALIASYNLLSLSYEALFLPMLCLTMAFWSKMEDTQSHNLYKKDDYFGSFLRNNREKIVVYIFITSWHLWSVSKSTVICCGSNFKDKMSWTEMKMGSQRKRETQINGKFKIK